MTEVETGNVTRYCKPSSLENGIVQSSAFEKRSTEKYLSVYLLEFFQKETEIKNVIEVITYMRTKTGFICKANGSFAVINIQQSKEYIFEEISLKISYKEQNLPHCGIFHDADDLLIAELLTECVQNNYIIKDITDSTNE
ncbi:MULTISPECIES: hypothetical protein [unclassified Nodularia (in: cyanobacteria)]|uniref:hypothetical protein n=1 Tax=unclassified Nodularia (in: cyanobacteria) TaxID=2656917 RepID=UPI00188082A9|nr:MULTISPECIES: hypothetical protein [unclassified Nodularia (in: cyanobacteria)]MBE9200778.1 hypothetical protein [Nodularia sp. LEGE 06071]MCC2695931.1 hypothetical protein [Nodularia sp. LEGE 04288]